jgi:hypothetical protein
MSMQIEKNDGSIIQRFFEATPDEAAELHRQAAADPDVKRVVTRQLESEGDFMANRFAGIDPAAIRATKPKI